MGVMRVNKKLIITVFFIILVSIMITRHLLIQPVRESLTYFPKDLNLLFPTAETQLTLLNEKDNDEYYVDWKVSSETDSKVYLRQDISFLFIDGILISTMSKWKENESLILQEERQTGEDSSHYQSISLHHAEVHMKDDEIKSAQTMTADELYVIDSSFSPLESFKQPSNQDQEDWKKVLDHAVNQHLYYSWNELIKYYNIDRDLLYPISLIELVKYQSTPLPGLTEEESTKVLGQLWEGLYKNYLLGIQISEEETVSPLGSKVPLILIGKDKSHLIILIETKNGQKVQLIQTISGTN
jgi:hypothetical protein